ncbi:MAG TPA: tetratricopeptide repeat protein [Rhodoblastus sp.]|nr:tetratricopeptide repeat protein [Rhodoblastus sp.]
MPAFSVRNRARPLAAISIVALALALGGCNRPSMGDVTGSIGGSDSLPNSDGALRQYSEEWGRRYDSNQSDKRTAMNYARSLRALSQHSQAVAVLRGLAITYPRDMEVLGAYGKALADDGKLQEASRVLANAHTPERPNWSILSAQGSVADQMGDHDRAREYYNSALKMRPNDPTVLSNLGLSYALSRNLPQAESTLRTAVEQPSADVRVRQNLALVLALQGKFAEAEEISRRDLSAADAASNVGQIRRMISQSNTWSAIRQVDGKAKGATARTAAPEG